MSRHSCISGISLCLSVANSMTKQKRFSSRNRLGEASNLRRSSKTTYQFNIAKKTHERGYKHLRDAIDLELLVRKKMARRKAAEGPAAGSGFAAYGAKSDKSLSGFCGQYMSKGSCSRGNNCQYVHDVVKKGSGKNGKGLRLQPHLNAL